MANKKTIKNKKQNSKILMKKNSNKYLQLLDNYFRIILIIIMMILVVLMLINNIQIKKVNDLVNKKTQTKEVIKKDKTIFLGDSITYGYDLQKYYNNKNFINKGVNGFTTSEVLDQIQESVFDYNTKSVILLIGTNDIGKGLDPTNNIELIITKIQNYDKDIQIFVESIYPVNESDNEKINKEVLNVRKNEKIIEVNKKIKQICKKKKVTYINMYDKLLDEKGQLKLEYTKEGLHLTEEGYTTVTNELSKYVNK